MDWREQANCRGTDTEMFFAGADGTSDPLGVRAWACGPCPVRGECLTDALMREALPRIGRHGIYGGMTPMERAQLWKESRQQ